MNLAYIPVYTTKEGLGVAFQKVGLDCDGLLIASAKRHLGVNELHRIWMAIRDGRVDRFHTPICSLIPSKNLPSCDQRNGVCAQAIYEIFTTYSYFHPISGDGNHLSFMQDV